MRPVRIAVAVLFALPAAAAAQPPVENPEFLTWARFKPGTTMVTKVTNKESGTESVIRTTTTLAIIGSDKLVLEVKTTRNVGGMGFDQPPTTRDVPRTVPLPPGLTPKEFLAGDGMPAGTVEKGTESVRVGMTEYPSRWYKFKKLVGEFEVEGKTWVSDEVPGGVVKSETTIIKDGRPTTKIEVVEFKPAK